MIRTQIQITKEQAAVLRAMSVERRRPVAELIRMSIDSFLQREAGISSDRKRARAKSAAGRFASSQSDVSAEHDRYLAEAMSQS
ncbi:MAG: CopG family transcriptional regulator [Acidobacteria bacterium]|nr:CopG family transcriptional regulator [Acidobacteriota bacterium]